MRKTQLTSTMKSSGKAPKGFTLMETVIAIGVLAVLLTGFLAVFTPASQGIRRSIDIQQADRLVTSLERELVTLRSGEETTIQTGQTLTTGFEKAFYWLINGDNPDQAIIVYQYRGSTTQTRDDGTPTPLVAIQGQPGEAFTVQAMARRLDDPEFTRDLAAVEGRIFFVKPIQLVQGNTGTLEASQTDGELQYRDTSGNLAPATSPENYLEAVIAFSAEFHSIPTKSIAYLQSPNFQTLFEDSQNPVFTRNLAIQR